jgi:phosphoserine phosphatase
MIVASDLNGTLTTGSPILAVARWVRKNQPERYPTGFISGLTLSYLNVKLGRIAIDTWAEINMQRALELVAVPSPSVIDQLMLAVARDELWEKRRVEPVRLLQQYHQAGAEIILISAAYQPSVQYFASLIGKERTSGIGTPINIRDGRVELAGKLNSREEKLHRLKTQIGEDQIDVALGDTFADIPILEQAKTAIAVHPDQMLLQVARERNWQVIGN